MGAEKMSKQHVVGQTRTAGFQIGVRRTFAISVAQAWDFLTSEEGQRIWLGEDCALALREGASYTTPGGTRGTVRVINPGVNLRLTWQPREWARASTIQIRTIPSGVNTVISFHQEGLADVRERATMRQRWQEAMAKLETHFPPTK
jgi:uncharacterized protein YndB with AHSA1/START domain